MKHAPRLILLADARRARLLRLTGRAGHLHADEINSLDNTEEGHEHRRPSMLDGRPGHHEAAAGHEMETFNDRFAKEIAQWLRRQTERGSAAPVTVVAPGKMLQPLKRALDGVGAFEFTEGELMNLTAAQIAGHARFQGPAVGAVR